MSVVGAEPPRSENDPNRKSKAVFAPFHVFGDAEIFLTQIKTLLAVQDILEKKHFGLRNPRCASRRAACAESQDQRDQRT